MTLALALTTYVMLIIFTSYFLVLVHDKYNRD